MAGGGATIWQGTALEECAGGRIILRHSQFESGHNINQICMCKWTSSWSCCFSCECTSQLTINVSQHLNGSTIECASESGRQVGNRQILLATGTTIYINFHNTSTYVYSYTTSVASLPTSNNVVLSEISNGQLTFS